MKLIYSPEKNGYYWEALSFDIGKTEISQIFETERAAILSMDKGKLRWEVI